MIALSRRKKDRKKTVKTQTVFRWGAYLLIASVPIVVLLVAFSYQPVQQIDSAWTRTGAQTSERIVTTTTRPRQRAAAILDQVSAYNANPQLIEEVRVCLVGAGYNVEVFSGVQVTVDLYRKLPSRGYDVIILRVHSTATSEIGEGRVASGGPVYLLTGEPHTQLGYAYEQTMGRVRAIRIEAGTFFGIGPDFVAGSMEGTFPGTLIVIAGCESLANKDLAKALIARGASKVIGWNDSVGLEHNDKTIIALTRSLFEKRLQVQEAIQMTMDQVGKDPAFQSYLLSYP